MSDFLNNLVVVCGIISVLLLFLGFIFVADVLALWVTARYKGDNHSLTEKEQDDQVVQVMNPEKRQEKGMVTYWIVRENGVIVAAMIDRVCKTDRDRENMIEDLRCFSTIGPVERVTTSEPVCIGGTLSGKKLKPCPGCGCGIYLNESTCAGCR